MTSVTEPQAEALRGIGFRVELRRGRLVWSCSGHPVEESDGRVTAERGFMFVRTLPSGEERPATMADLLRHTEAP